MKNMIMKLLGLNTLVSQFDATLASHRKEIEELKKTLAELNEKVEEIESPDMDNYVSEDDINDRIESYVNDNDLVSQSYVDDEIESKVSDAIENEDIQSKIDEAIENLDLDSKPSSKVSGDVTEAVRKAIAEVLSKAYDHVQKS